MGCDVCYTNHAEADQDDMDTLLVLLATAGVQLHHGRAGRRRRDAQLPEHLVPRRACSCATRSGLKRAPEFEAWLQRMQITDAAGRLAPTVGAGATAGADMSRLARAGRDDAARTPSAPPIRLGALRRPTPARIALGRARHQPADRRGAALRLAHAQARDAVHARSTPTRSTPTCAPQACDVRAVRSRAADRADLPAPARPRPPARRRTSGRALRAGRRRRRDVCSWSSPTACRRSRCSATPRRCSPRCARGCRQRRSFAPVVVAHAGARGARRRDRRAAAAPRCAVVLIGERPGPELARQPGRLPHLRAAPGRHDAERNCISNIRPEGLALRRAAAFKLAWLMRERCGAG